VQRVQIHGLACMERVEIDWLDRIEIELRPLQASRKRWQCCLVGEWLIQVRLNRLPHLRLDGFGRWLLALGRVYGKRLGRVYDRRFGRGFGHGWERGQHSRFGCMLIGLRCMCVQVDRRRRVRVDRRRPVRIHRLSVHGRNGRLGRERGRWQRLHARQPIEERLELRRQRVQFAHFVERFSCLGELTGLDRSGSALQTAVRPPVTHARLEALPLRRRDVRGVIDGVADRHTSIRHVSNRSCKRCASMLSCLVRR
jgi:hypothetical protein